MGAAIRAMAAAEDQPAYLDGLLQAPPVDSDSKVLIPPHEMIRAFFNRYDLDLSGTMNSNNELKQLTVNLIVNLQLEATVELIEEAVSGSGDMSTLNWNIDQFKDWFYKTFGFSAKEHLPELTKATVALSAELETLQETMLECDDAAKTAEYEKELSTIEANQTLLANKVREFNKMEAENKAKADAALEKKKLAEEARARKKAREAGAREASIAQNTAACEEVSKQIEDMQEAILDEEDDDAIAKLTTQLDKLLLEQTELAAKVRALNASAAASP